MATQIYNVDNLLFDMKVQRQATTGLTITDGTTSSVVNLHKETMEFVDSSTVNFTTTGTDTVSANIIDASVSSTKLANNSVTTAKIADANVTNVKLANSSVGATLTSNNASDVTFAGASLGANLSLNIPNSSATQRGALTSTDWTTFNQKLSAALPDGNIYVGGAGNTAATVALSGDATLSNVGVLTVANNAITTPKLADGSVTFSKQAHGVFLTGNSNAVLNASQAGYNVFVETNLTSDQTISLPTSGVTVGMVFKVTNSNNAAYTSTLNAGVGNTIEGFSGGSWVGAKQTFVCPVSTRGHIDVVYVSNNRWLVCGDALGYV